MPESLDAFAELRSMRARLEGIEHRQEMLVRAHSSEILSAIWTYIDADETLGEVFLLVDGKRTQQDIASALKAKGLSASQPTVSRKLTKLNVELGLVEIGDRDAAGTVYAKSDIDRILHLTSKIERRLADRRKAKSKMSGTRSKKS
jgi:DNA-binding transcriptional ArsR family regulator